MKKSIFTFILLLVAFTANAQSISVGSEYVQLGVSQNSAFAEATYSQNLIWKFNTKVSAGVGIVQSESESFVHNGDTKRFNGYTESNANVAFIPSAMVGIDIPVNNLKIGIYSGFRSYNFNPFFEPVSISVRF